MKRNFLIFMIASFVGAGCREPTPEKVVPRISKEDSLIAVYQAYNGERPIFLDGRTVPVYPTRVINGPNDTIYFNKNLWSHRPEIQKVTTMFRHPNSINEQDEILTVFLRYKSVNFNDYDDFQLVFPSRVGTYKTDNLRDPNLSLGTGYALMGSDYVGDEYKLDPKADNWVQVSKIDLAAKKVAGRFSLHFILARSKAPYLYNYLVLPNTFHLHGSFNY